MYKYKRYFLFSFLLFYGFKTISQELLFEKPYNLSNLPSNECYNITQDKEGYIWFSTDAGLCKYNGNNIKVFSKNEGLPEESCYGIASDSKGFIYVITSSNRILKIINDSLYELKFTKDFQLELSRKAYFVTDFKIISDSLFIINTQVNTYKVNIKSNYFELIDSEKLKHQFNIINSNVYSIKSYVEAKEYRNNKERKTKLLIKYKDKTFETEFLNSLNIKGSKLRIKSILHRGNLYIGFGTALIKVEKSGKSEAINLNDEILAMQTSNDGNLYVGIQNIGLVCFTRGILSESNKLTVLKKVSVTGISIDKSGGIWCSTLENGVLYCENSFIYKINHITFKNTKSCVFKKVNSFVWLSDINGDLWKTNGLDFTYYRIGFTNKKITSEITSFQEDYFLATDKGIIKYDCNFLKEKTIHLKELRYGYSAKNLVVFDSKLFGINHTSLFEVKNNIVVEKILRFNSKASSLLTNKKELFIVNEKGIFSVDTNNYNLKLLFELNQIKKTESLNEQNDFIVLTKEAMLIIKNKNKYTFKFDNIENLRINDFCRDNERIWLATNIGIIEIPDYKKLHYIIYNSHSGLPNKEFFKLAKIDDNIIAATEDEVYLLKNNWTKAKTVYNKPIIKNILVNENEINITTLNNLPYYKNQIKFIIDNLNFENENRELKFRITGPRNDSGTIYKQEINFADLSPGSYELIVFDQKPLEQKFTEAISLKFSIEKPFWQKIWFYLLVILSTGVIVYLIIRSYFKRLRIKDIKEAELANLINNYQMAAIRAQMNPHFIFNCINSIQRYVLTNDKTTAYNYLTKFSKLIRLVLNNSEEENISLKNELEMVGLYIQLEQLRFEDSFTYDLVVSANLDTDNFFIPPMMLQPYIENSIWHGLQLLNNSRKGKISISVSEENDMLRIEIIDNGVGREEALKHASKTHKSKANKLNEKRISIINNINQTINGSINITDIINDKDQSIIGTKVTLIIPQSYE